MTRFLSQILNAPEPDFRQGLRRLEFANGNPSHDVRLTSEVIQAARQKLLELGLDPVDTTSEELYRSLQERVGRDDACLTHTLRTAAATHVSAEADVVAGMVHVLKGLPEARRSFALKNSRLKAMLKAVPPKKAMKKLGYRSLDSMLKHEAPVSIMAAAWLSEGDGWQKRFIDQYKKLQPGDFETRSILITHFDSKRWQKLAAEVVSQSKHNVMALRELGALIFLPLPPDAPVGAVTASLSLGLHELNEIRAASTFLQMSQVKADFGHAVRTIAADEAKLKSKLFDQPVPWHLVQRYYARLADKFRQDLFEPYLQLEDMVWQPVEHSLSQIEPSLKFWQNTAALGWLDGRKPVSLNIVDAALNACNQLPYERQVVHFFQRALWHELLLKYFNHQPVEDTVLAELQPELTEAVK